MPGSPGGQRCTPVPLFRSLDAAVKHRPSPRIAALSAGKRRRKGPLNDSGMALKEHPHQREDLPAPPHMGASQYCDGLDHCNGQGVEEGGPRTPVD